VHSGAESFECFDLFLHFCDSHADLVELFQVEEPIADGTFEQDIDWHKVEV